jgi:hypothetical protein
MVRFTGTGGPKKQKPKNTHHTDLFSDFKNQPTKGGINHEVFDFLFRIDHEKQKSQIHSDRSNYCLFESGAIFLF